MRSPTRRAVPALIVAACVTAAALSAVAVAATSTRSLTNGQTELSFNKKTLKAPKGKVTLRFRNTGAADHNIALRGGSLKSSKRGAIVGTGKTSTVTATLKPGRYTYFCSVPGHEQAGMKGILTVRK